MTFFQAIFLAVIQGLTEFLPVSSSGHLVVFQKLFGLEPPVIFDILVHVGSLFAILIYFNKKFKLTKKTVLLIVIATLPATIVGLFLNEFLEVIFNSLKLVGLALLINSFLLFSGKYYKKGKKTISQLSWLDALVIGLFQAVAILPGVSRSGSTIIAGLWRKAESKTAFYFSFYLAVPAILGALFLQIPDMTKVSTVYLSQGILGMLIAGIVGYFSLSILENVLKSTKLWLFGIYCFLLGLTLLAF